ncbi:MAG: hypothetical protein GXX92_09610 [Clostridiales bacterium]|jgi:hypothetical protein|nr:hypothetical protein [Clostridiales bacterium]
MNKKEQRMLEVFEKKDGIFQLMPAFVYRKNSKPGRRLRLHPDDYYACAPERGAIEVRFLSSVIMGGYDPLTPEDEGLSYISLDENDPENRILLRDAIAILGKDVIGEELWKQYGTFPMNAKFFDFGGPLFHHLHLDFDAAARVGKGGKAEGYFYPVQYNNYLGTFPYTFFGFSPNVTKEEVRERMEFFLKGDNRLTELSRAYRIQMETGWYTPPGVLHAPGSCLTYEPQLNSDASSVFENVTEGERNGFGALTGDCPEGKKFDIDYIMSLLDWEKNVDPDYRKHNFRPKLRISSNADYEEYWIMYGNPYISAKQLIVKPGKGVLIKDRASYGCILVQGHGRFGSYDCETPILIRLGQMTADEFFVSEERAREGVFIQNMSKYEPLVILKHFGSNNVYEPDFTTG